MKLRHRRVSKNRDGKWTTKPDRSEYLVTIKLITLGFLILLLTGLVILLDGLALKVRPGGV